MRGNEFLDKMSLVDPAYVEAAALMPRRRKNSLKRWCAIAACLCLVLSLALPAMAENRAFYNALYTISPATAQFFKPVQLSCEDNGIRMEVTAAYIHEDTAEIYISMQDLEETRFDETIDLFDSYRINSPFDCTSHCQFSSYDPDTHTATFLITIEQWNKHNIVGDKLTFTIREFLSNKKTYEGIIDGVSLANIGKNAVTQTVAPRGYTSATLNEENNNTTTETRMTTLKPGSNISSPINGVSLTGIGYVDGALHVQTYYKDILKTDNHGSIALINKETSEIITCNGSIAFFDDEGKGSYEDYIFTGIAAETLDEYELYGDFTTSQGSVEGNWSVTFPLKDTHTDAVK
ncbi:DUF4179 domain-containing protein [Blautia schinkii]|nr:DUF4179 domain-containing protein [Blautia schinkii]